MLPLSPICGWNFAGRYGGKVAKDGSVVIMCDAYGKRTEARLRVNDVERHMRQFALVRGFSTMAEAQEWLLIAEI